MNPNNPNLWSALSVSVAIVALILTQLPTIRQMTRGTDIRINTPQEISIWHDMGNINVGVFLDIHNVGGYTVNISSVECAILEKDTGKVFRIPVRTYSSERASNLSLGTITLSADQHWTNYVQCSDFFPRAELEQVTDLKAKINTDLIDKRDKLSNQDKASVWIPIDDALYQKVVRFFDKKFGLTNEGNYQFFIKAVSDSGELLRVQGFDFTLFKSNIEALKEVVERDYKYGSGIVAAYRYTWAVVVPIAPMNENESRLVFQQRIASR